MFSRTEQTFYFFYYKKHFGNFACLESAQKGSICFAKVPSAHSKLQEPLYKEPQSFPLHAKKAPLLLPQNTILCHMM
jgi:hypothetical protein